MTSKKKNKTHEGLRLNEINKHGENPWKNWGPYLSERAWGTVREDYSPSGDAWEYLPFDIAKSKAYRWGEDGLAGFCDRYQSFCFSLALWNEQDPILKERAFGLTHNEGNHGEDVKDYYFYVDSTPTHSWMKYLYKYPQNRFPYEKLREESRRRTNHDPEYELLDTGIFDDNKYWDVFVDYAKNTPEDIFIKITAHNRGTKEATLHLIPQFWFRNTWGWGEKRKQEPNISLYKKDKNYTCFIADDTNSAGVDGLHFDYKLGKRYIYCEYSGTEDNPDRALFTDNETNTNILYGTNHQKKYFKDGFNWHIVNKQDTVKKSRNGTKACVDYNKVIPGGGSFTTIIRITNKECEHPFEVAETVFKRRENEADEFYEAVHPPLATPDEKMVQRQAFAGLMFSKQNYIFDVKQWLEGDDPRYPPAESRNHIRNQHWKHLNSQKILSMPDKWEYPWFAAWDLAFHTIPIALIDTDFAKKQLWNMLFEQFQHPNGQIPAYEWEFSDVNPPVHAFAVWRVYNMDRIDNNGKGDLVFLEKCFHKLLLNFSWWVNKVDSLGNNIFEGGFLGLDNITFFDRSKKLEDGGILQQSDATGWMGMYCQNLMRIALELAKTNKVYEGLATKFFEHYVYVGSAMKHMGDKSDCNLWDEEDGFFYDVIRYPNAVYKKVKVRSLIGIIPMFAVERLEEEWIEPFTEFKENLKWFVNNRKSLVSHCINEVYKEKHHTNPKDKQTSKNTKGGANIDVNSNTDNMVCELDKTYVMTIVSKSQIKKILSKIWDENEFKSPYGLRSLSKIHENHPYRIGGVTVAYEPKEAITKLKGGNSNWRGPIWFPTTFLLIESLRKLGKGYGEDLSITDKKGNEVIVGDVAKYYANSLISIFTKDKHGKRACYGDIKKWQNDEHWNKYIAFGEYFDGDTGKALGAIHQTGWTALVASLIDEWRQ